MGRKLDSATVEQDRRVLPHARHAPAGRSAQRSGRRGARVQRAQRRSTRCATSPSGSASCAAAARRCSSSAKGSTTTSTTSSAATDRTTAARRCHRRDARRDRRGDAVERQHLRHRPARPDRPRRRVDRDRSRSPTTRRSASARGSLQNELRLSQDSLRTLSEETGGFAAVNRNDFATAFERIVEDNSSYYVLAYYPPDAQAGRQVPQDRGARDAARARPCARGAATSTPKQGGADDHQDRRARRRRSCARRSTARCRSAA